MTLSDLPFHARMFHPPCSDYPNNYYSILKPAGNFTYN